MTETTTTPKVGDFVIVQGVTFHVDEVFENSFFGSDQDGDDFEFSFDQIHAVCP